NVALPGSPGMSNVQGELDEVLGAMSFEDEDESTVEVCGDDQGWTEIVGEGGSGPDDYVLGCDVLGLNLGAASSVQNPAVAQRAAVAAPPVLAHPVTAASTAARASVPVAKPKSLASLAAKSTVPVTKSTLAAKMGSQKVTVHTAAKSRNKSPHKLALTRTL